MNEKKNKIEIKETMTEHRKQEGKWEQESNTPGEKKIQWKGEDQRRGKEAVSKREVGEERKKGDFDVAAADGDYDDDRKKGDWKWGEIKRSTWRDEKKTQEKRNDFENQKNWQTIGQQEYFVDWRKYSFAQG